jgi:hypothetical protein
MKKSGFGGYKSISPTDGLRLSVEQYQSLQDAVLKIGGSDLVFFGTPESTTLDSNKISRWNSLGGPIYFDQSTPANRSIITYGSRPDSEISSTTSTWLSTKVAGGYGTVNLSAATSLTVCAYMKISVENFSGVLWENSPGGAGGAYQIAGGSEVQLYTSPSSGLPAGKMYYQVARGHAPTQYQTFVYRANMGSYGHYVFHFSSSKDNGTGNSIKLYENTIELVPELSASSPANFSPAISTLTGLANSYMHWGSNYNTVVTPHKISSLIIIKRELTSAERQKIYEVQKAIGKIIQ